MDPMDMQERFLDTLDVIQTLLELIEKRESEINALYERIEKMQEESARKEKEKELLEWSADLDLYPAGRLMATNSQRLPIRDGIIIIETLVPLRMKLREMLSASGLPIIAEGAGLKETLEKIRDNKPRLVVLGTKLEDQNGISAIISLRKQFPDIKAILMTEKDNIGEVIAAIQHHGIEVLVKPINRLRLVEMVGTLLNQNAIA